MMHGLAAKVHNHLHGSMSAVKKDAVYPVKVWPPGWDHGVDLTPMIPALKKRVDEFIAAGLPIPVVWRHDDGAVPGKEKLGELMAGDARLALGWATGSSIDADGIFQGDLEIPDEADRNEMKKSRYVSPWIKDNWRDGSGKVWPGPSILHFAVTPRPVQHGQQPFALGHDGHSLDLRLALSDYERGEPMADDKPKESKEKEPKVKDEGGKLKDIIKCLSELDPPIILPSDTDETTFLDRLHVGCMTAGGHKADDKGGDMNSPVPPPPGGKESPTEVKDQANPMGLSLSHEDKALLEQAKGAVAFAQEVSRKDMLNRITKLRGNMAIGKPALDKLESELTGLKLSLDPTGKPNRSEVLAKIEALEDVPLLLSHNGEQPRPVPHPEEEKKEPDAHVMAKLTESRWKGKAKPN